jgi:DNA/RNA-binding domain of Phe-tRNA-synthetase-like protein
MKKDNASAGAGGFFEVTQAWRAAYPTAHAGVLVMRGVANPIHCAPLQDEKARLEGELRSRYAGWDRARLRADPTLEAYARYYGQFDKTYHVQLQLESVLFRGKSIHSGAALVEAMFMAELTNMLLTAGHDLDAVQDPVTLEVARGTESYILLRGTEQTTKAGDMMMVDAQGILSSVLYGPDQRTQIGEQTTNALFTVYGPEGIAEAAIEKHLRDIQRYVALIAPQARPEMIGVFSGA